ncbi:Aste57867_15572 [Aphanomyces stellatus]|uniref:Aste57867_15572 protein n=1 Tax=Aphanomyces stellatus TaxID=120398 RepID=A0A485L4S4_9STRA|nr:hypothetical protein As57867_015516 [Aphanomyces stellatus]VFT92374.1 Aste57867_15572 [Aphanomyces stellatus]
MTSLVAVPPQSASPTKTPHPFLQKIAEKTSTPGGKPEGQERTLKLFTGTWNVGNKMPPSTSQDINCWIPEGGGDYDIIAVGLQESTYKKKSNAPDSPGHREVETVPEHEHEDDDDDEDAARDIELHEVVLDEVPKKKELPKHSSIRHAFSELTKRPSMTPSTYPFFTQLAEHLGSNYMQIGAVELMEIRLAVYVHTRNEAGIHRFSDVEKVTEATGVGNVIGNKVRYTMISLGIMTSVALQGGAVLKVVVNQRSFCFVNCHLAAHEAQKFLERRNSDVAEILNGARVGQKSVELDHQFDHAFWFGDMNYRISLGYTDPKEMSKEDHWSAVHALVQAKDYGKLFENDQLQHQMHANKVLSGWTTIPCNFPPTFKRLRGKTDEFTKQRTPSWCDRVLWKSLPGFEKNLRLIEYNCVPSITTSDHKPVFASFEVLPIGRPALEGSPHDMVDVKLTGVSASNLDAMDIGGTSDPYIKFYCSVPDLLLSDETKRPQTAVLKNTLNPQWDDTQVPPLQFKCQLSDLNSAHLIMLLMDYDATSTDDLLGQATLYLPDFYVPGESVPFETTVIRNGIHAGVVRGSIAISPSGKHFADWEKNSSRVPGCTCSTM